LVFDGAATAVEKLRSLPPGQKEAFAAEFAELTAKLGARVDDVISSRKVLPAELPAALPQPNVKYKVNRRRGYTGREAAEEEEKNQRRAQRKANQEAELRHAENQAWNTEIVRDYQTVREQLLAYAVSVGRRQGQERLAVAPPTTLPSPTPTTPPQVSTASITISLNDSDETESKDEYDIDIEKVDIVPSTIPSESTLLVPLANASSLTSTGPRKRQKRHWSQILPPHLFNPALAGSRQHDSSRKTQGT
jgi:hypothetical protein